MNNIVNYVDRDRIENGEYIVVKYYLKSSVSLLDAANKIAIGQSIGNPDVRNSNEYLNIIDNHLCVVLNDIDRSACSGVVEIGFPVVNFNFREDGISHLLCQIAGGQFDFDSIEKCAILDIVFPDTIFNKYKLAPTFGISGIREYTNVYNKPLLGGIIKPKIGMNIKELSNVVLQMADNGINFIKEDEILSNQPFCPFVDRVAVIPELLYKRNYNIIYAFSITSDYPFVFNRVRSVAQCGGNAVHVNIWSGLGVYKSIREMNLPLFLFFQKSGDKIFTNKLHNFYIDWSVVCKLGALSGIDFIHAGMYNGYLSEDLNYLNNVLSILRSADVMPSMSCGMHPGIVNGVTDAIGCDYLANCGGSIHGHPGGTVGGTIAMRQAIDREYGDEYNKAVELWGKK
jgi:ribulose-bisphosphate carboxylase large chain